MLSFGAVNWKIYTKQIAIEGGVVLRWFWRKPVGQGREESARGFTTRAECEADAARHGYRRADESPPDD